MDTLTFRAHRIAILVAFVFLLFSSCDILESTEESVLDAKTLLPFETGRTWVFSAYSLDTLTSQKIPSTVHREVSKVLSKETIGGKSAFPLIDSVYSPSGLLEYTETQYFTFVEKDAFMWFEDVPDLSKQSWVPLVKTSAGLNVEYEIVEWTNVHEGDTVKATLKGKINPKESVTVPIGTVEAYRFDLIVRISVSGVVVNTSTESIYLADGYGPVKIHTPVRIGDEGKKSVGEESVLVSKNF